MIFFNHSVIGAPANNVIQTCSDKTKDFNDTYPHSRPVIINRCTVKYRLAIISDLDSKSKSCMQDCTWISYMKKGYLIYKIDDGTTEFEWDEGEDIALKSNLAVNGRGMELSELVTYDGRLLTFDDKTGIIYEMHDDHSLSKWVVVTGGDGKSSKAFKLEWATVKDKKLYVGTHGRELKQPNSDKLDYSGMWIKVIDSERNVEHVDWIENYKKLQAKLGISYPGYLIHESCVWSSVNQKYFFLPRKASHGQYDCKVDETNSTNILLSASPDFEDIKVVRIGEIIPTRGYSSFKFVPGTDESLIVAIKSEEVGETTGTFISVFTIDGKIIYEETQVSNRKFEGIEFV
ncbi:soluble calcium-activated nucleotidase 1-like [Adelges cooleyi]|uniref:soluble calcium-activated nucleotidase 1-like n=1 Tax=Adelges cooleyi TaxID=133065 RepID=UPI002180176A|nr:soluble calcium-activated nucleotidase 1-like [Adelges cooleyi]